MRWFVFACTVLVCSVALAWPDDEQISDITENAVGGASSIHMNDDTAISFGGTSAAPDCWFEWDTAATPDAMQLVCTDIDGGGTDGVVCYIDTGTRVWHCLGGLTIAGTLSGASAIDATTETTIETAIDTLANLTSIQSQTISLAGAFTVEAGGCTCNQDLTTDASVVFANAEVNGAITGANDETLANSVNGQWVFTDVGGNAEALAMDLGTTSNQVAFTSSTGILYSEWGTIDLATDKLWCEAIDSTGGAFTWTPIDNNAAAINILPAGMSNQLLKVVTTDGVEQVLIGDGANTVDFPHSGLFVSLGDTAAAEGGSQSRAIVGECAHASNLCVGGHFFASTNATSIGYAINAQARVGTTTDTTDAIAGRYSSSIAHTGAAGNGDNIGINIAVANSSNQNDALRIDSGDVNTTAISLDWDMIDHTDDALCFDPGAGGSSLMCYDTTNGTENIDLNVDLDMTARASDLTLIDNTVGALEITSSGSSQPLAKFNTSNGTENVNFYSTLNLREADGDCGYWKEYHVGANAASPGGSGATLAVANNSIVYLLDDTGEYLYGITDIHSDWDAASDIVVEVMVALTAAETADDIIEGEVIATYYGEHDDFDTGTKTQTRTVNHDINTEVAQGMVHKLTFVLDYDLVDNVIEANDTMALRFRLDAQTNINAVHFISMDLWYRRCNPALQTNGAFPSEG